MSATQQRTIRDLQRHFQGLIRSQYIAKLNRLLETSRSNHEKLKCVRRLAWVAGYLPPAKGYEKSLRAEARELLETIYLPALRATVAPKRERELFRSIAALRRIANPVTTPTNHVN